MPWEKRGKKKYYYRNMKQPDGSWKKTYFGKGLRAEVESMIREKEQAQKRKQRDISKQVASAKTAHKRQQKSTVDLVNLMMAGDGYHNPMTARFPPAAHLHNQERKSFGVGSCVLIS